MPCEVTSHVKIYVYHLSNLLKMRKFYQNEEIMNVHTKEVAQKTPRKSQSPQAPWINFNFYWNPTVFYHMNHCTKKLKCLTIAYI